MVAEVHEYATLRAFLSLNVAMGELTSSSPVKNRENSALVFARCGSSNVSRKVSAMRAPTLLIYFNGGVHEVDHAAKAIKLRVLLDSREVSHIHEASSAHIRVV